ncbi:hypothetical protein [Sinorhizobium medicae]|uniref:hypothetical protein n=1 Tax=Sinorhizobium medicae TaxID=110321 RepID=UPI001297437B|nr:hypothetical protein [Sinorhizobium medicae]MDX0967309.1 hypothetical protein [Sinorhizobium medicae]MQV46321.1 hypothetical protein [Sinorhizobium medicae]MQV54052.1 hypothetical protein [Sinorhizobium medicae]MQV71691.1 hypothetical protein [Sinorhizobium medicae]
MAKKNRIPKKIAGVKVPKPLRKSKMLRSMMASDLGRDVLAKALTAGAGAAAAVLADRGDAVGETARTATKKGTKALDVAGEAVRSGFSAAMEVVENTIFPLRSEQKKTSSKGGSAPAIH